MTIREQIHAVMRAELSVEPPEHGTDLIASGLFDSLAIVALVVGLEQAVGVRIPLDGLALDDLRTVERLEALLASSAAAGGEVRSACHDPLADEGAQLMVPLRAGRGRPLYMIHDADGSVFELQPIAEAVRTVRPIWGLRAVGRDPMSEPQRTIEEMAGTYLGEVRRIQPHGPYALVGKGIGGVVAFELARRLHAARAEVDVLALIVDEHAFGDGRRRSDDEAWMRQIRVLAEAAAAAYRPSIYHGSLTVFHASARTPSRLDPCARCARHVAGTGRLVALRDVGEPMIIA